MNEVFDLRYRRPVLGRDQAEVVSIPLDGVPSGAYYLALGIEQARSPELVLGRQQFYLINPELPPEQPRTLSEDELFLQSPFATMDEAQLAVEVASARLIARPSELDAYDQLTEVPAKRRFLFRFWLQRDPDPSTPANERYEEFRKAREYAAQFYRTQRFLKAGTVTADVYSSSMASQHKLTAPTSTWTALDHMKFGATTTFKVGSSLCS